MDWRDYIERKSGVMLGKPVFKGTRMTVEYVLERSSDGATHDDLLDNYSDLTPDRIRAAIAYAVSVLKQDDLLLSAV